jgi:hypothetical protein
MPIKKRGTVILLALSVVIGAIYFFYVIPSEKENKLKEELSRRFFRVNKSQIEFLRIQNFKGTFNIAKNNDEWQITLPMHLPTDHEAINELLHVITNGKIVKIISTDIKRRPEFALDTPMSVLNIGYGGKIDELSIGNQNPGKTGYYAFVKGINAIFLIDEKTAKISSLGLYELREKSLFRFDSDIITSIKIIKKNNIITLNKQENTWRVISPLNGKADSQEIMAFLDELLNQRAIEFYDDQIPDISKFSNTIKLLLSDNKSELNEIDVYYWGTGATEGTVAYQKGEKYAGRLPRDFWIFIDREASDFRYRNLFDFKEENVGRIKVTKNTVSYNLARKSNNWYVDGDMANGERVTAFMWLLKDWKADKILNLISPIEKEKNSLEIVVHDGQGNTLGRLIVSEKIESESIGFDRDKQEFFLHYAIADNLENICAVSGLEMIEIPDKEHFMQ